ncbi:hypothetical protein Cgig2_022579 [Carnegiea gigantea]|uniref:Uncharacterized protein n=1 Tax=Carnegiea gigantea TaxID=171969 RepID=A0A9Q1KLL8_9CARY|nr:hypothetical protein Cgig2_022579 [Carnegiea gigantea]
MDIKESPQWTRLTFVSCACNGLILMDESLQLLPAAETLDLSRNRFAKVDNLRKCTKLAHLDLGFNQLRSVASFREVTCHISKLVLRCNALTTLRGIENLKSIEQLDVSYNTISNFLELEVLSSLPSLKDLWLEGNPVCCARWYRPQVFSFFAHPEQVKLDDLEMSTREYWKMQIIFARRQRRPASFGFYYPAREGNGEEGLADGKRKKLSRLACIENDKHGMNMFLEQDSFSYDTEIADGDEIVISDNEGEITSLINRIELMKKERSGLWVNDFKGWMDEGSQNVVDGCNNGQAMLAFGERNLGDMTSLRHLGESSRCADYASYSTIASGDDRSTNFLESNSSFPPSSAGTYGHPWFVSGTENVEKYMKFADCDSASVRMNVQGVDKMAAVSMTPSTPITNIVGSQSSSVRSPPQYQEDILHRRHYLEEEFYQLSAKSLSAASSDSDTSCDADGHECPSPSPKVEQFIDEEILGKEIDWGLFPLLVGKDDDKHIVPDGGQRPWSSFHLCSQRCTEFDPLEHSFDAPPGGINDDIASSHNKDADNYDKKNSKKKLKRRVVSLSEDKFRHFSGDDFQDEHKKHTVHNIECTLTVCGEFDTQAAPTAEAEVPAPTKRLASKPEDYIQNYFNSCVADAMVHETCEQYILCGWVADGNSSESSKDVAVVLSSEGKLYVLLYNDMLGGSGNDLSLLSSHKVEDVSEVFVGLGLQVVRIYIDEDATYILITKNVEKTRQLLCMMKFLSHGEKIKYSLRSLELAQINLFDTQICGGVGISIYQYCMVLFWHNNDKGISRSLSFTSTCRPHLFPLSNAGQDIPVMFCEDNVFTLVIAGAPLTVIGGSPESLIFRYLEFSSVGPQRVELSYCTFFIVHRIRTRGVTSVLASCFPLRYDRTIMAYSIYCWGILPRNYQPISMLRCRKNLDAIRKTNVLLSSERACSTKSKLLKNPKKLKAFNMERISVIEAEETQCVTLTLEARPREHCLSAIVDTVKAKVGFQDKNGPARMTTWKLKWFSAESLSNFIVLLKALHAEMATSSLCIRYIS